jgi:hypothetical protein
MGMPQARCPLDAIAKHWAPTMYDHACAVRRELVLHAGGPLFLFLALEAVLLLLDAFTRCVVQLRAGPG